MSVRRTLAALAGAALLISGCSNDPEPRFAPTESPSPTESATSAEPAAQTPEAFIREWVDAYNAFEDSGDATEFDELNSRCGTCGDIIDVVETAYRRGGFVRSAGWSIDGPIVQTYSRPRASGATVNVQVAPSRYKASEDSRVERGRGGSLIMEFDLALVEGVWRVSDVTRRAA